MANSQSSEEKYKSLAGTITDLMNNQPLKYTSEERLRVLEFVTMCEVLNMLNEEEPRITEEQFKSMWASLKSNKEINEAVKLCLECIEKEEGKFGRD